MKQLYNVTFSQTSRNGVHGLREQHAVMSDDDIILAAERDLSRSGYTLESIIGIRDIERPDGTIVPERMATDDELLEAAIARLSSDGRLFQVQARTPDVIAAEIEAEIASAEDIFDLRDALNRAADAPADVQHYIDLKPAAFRTFGGTEPADTEGIFSWDADHLLVPDSRRGRGWAIVEREEVQS